MDNDIEPKKKSNLGLLAFVFIVGMSVAAVGISLTPGGKRTTEVKDLVNQCEKDLPRSQTCAIIAVPKQLGEMK